MEANYNNVMNEIQKPSTMCHELAHLRGYILEDEANFIAYLACVQSEDVFFEYSGYLSVLSYLNSDLLALSRRNPTIYAEALRKHSLIEIDPVVQKDDTFVSEAEWDRINKKAWFDTEAVDAAADVYLEDSRMRFGSMRMGLTYEMDPYERYLEYADSWMGWDWKSYWLSTFAQLRFDTFDDGYFPTRGFRFSWKGRFVFKGYSIDLDPLAFYKDESVPTTENGRVPRYLTTMASIEGAFSLGDHFSILPKFYVGWYHLFGVNEDYQYSDFDYMNPKHVVTLGGFIQDRYTENQIPFFLWPTGYRKGIQISSLTQVDLRYRFLRKNYISARSGLFVDTNELKELRYSIPFWAFGAEYSRQTLAGPLRVAAQWGPIFGFSIYGSIGFDF